MEIYIKNKKILVASLIGFIMVLSIHYTVFTDEVHYFPSDIRSFGSDGNTLVLAPYFTAIAYSDNGFYDYFKKECDETCLTLKFEKSPVYTFESSKNAMLSLKKLNYDVIPEHQVHYYPEILEVYEKIIVLHNEYITKKMFNAITSHPNVIYLYPNSLYAEIEILEDKNSFRLVRGHGYPDSTVDNGFDWKYDNTRPYEFDRKCKNWNFTEIENGFQLNCYPEKIIKTDKKLLQAIHDLSKIEKKKYIDIP